MAQRSYFWDTAGGGDGVTVTQEHLMDHFFRALLNGTGNRGVLRGWRDELEVTGTEDTVSVASGGAILYGMFYENDAAVSVAIPAASSGTRTDLIVVRRGWNAKTCRILRVAGPSAALTQTVNTTWDIPLASVVVDTAGTLTVTDTREFCIFGTTFPANSIDTEQFNAAHPVPASKIANRTRSQFRGAGRMESQSSPHATSWVANGGSYNCYELDYNNYDGLWTYFMPPTGIVGTADFYVWNAPDVNGSASGAEYVYWAMTVYQCFEDNQAIQVDQTESLEDQQARVNTRFYADRISTDVSVAPGYPVIVLVQRWGLLPSVSESASPSATASPSASASASPSRSQSPSASASPSPSASASPSPSASQSPSASESASASASQSPSATQSPSASGSASASASPAWDDTYNHAVRVLGVEMRYTADC